MASYGIESLESGVKFRTLHVTPSVTMETGDGAEKEEKIFW